MHLDKPGLLINAAVSTAIAIVAVIVGLIIIRRQREARVRAPGYAFAFYWIALALLYFFVAVRTVFGYMGLQQLDLIFFFVDNVFGGFMIPCAVFLFFYLITNRKIAVVAGSISTAIWLAWNIINISAGANYLPVNFWYTEWEPVSAAARYIAIFGLYVPGVVSVLAMNFALLRAQSRLARYRIILTSVSMAVAISVIIIDYLAPGPPWLRLIILLAALVGLVAYVPPRFLRPWLERK